MSILDKNLNGVRDIITSLGSDFSRSYLFSISIPSLNDDSVGSQSPSKGPNYFGTDKLTVFARSFDLPSYTLKVKSIDFNSVQLQMVEGVQFNHSWTAEFLSDDTNVLRGKLLRWSNLAYDFNRKAAATPTSYKRKAILSQLDKNGNPICIYTMYGTFPRKIDGGSVSHDNISFQKFNVEFRYDYFTVEILKYVKNSKEAKIDNKLGESDLRVAAPTQTKPGTFLGSQAILPA